MFKKIAAVLAAACLATLGVLGVSTVAGATSTACQAEWSKSTPNSHEEWRFQTRVHRPDNTVERKYVKGYDFVSGGQVTVRTTVVSGHWVASSGWHQIPDSVINAYWGSGGITESLLGGSESNPKGNVGLNVYGGPNVSVPYYAAKVTISGGYTDWGPWSGWTTTDPGASNDTRNVEHRTVQDDPTVQTVYLPIGQSPEGDGWTLTGQTKGDCRPQVSLPTPIFSDDCGIDSDYVLFDEPIPGNLYIEREADRLVATPPPGSVFANLAEGWTLNEDGTATWLLDGTEFTDVPCDQPPVKDPTYTDWVGGEPACGDTTVVEHRTRVDYTYTYAGDGQWDEHTTETVETREVDITPEPCPTQTPTPTPTVTPTPEPTVTPTPEPTVTPTPEPTTPSATPTPTKTPVAPVSHPKPPVTPLAHTGADGTLWYALGAAGLVGVGTTALLIRRRRA